MLEVVEDHESVGEHQGQVRNSDRVGIRLTERLDGADQVVGEHPDGATGERGQVGELGGLKPVQLGLRDRIGIAAVAIGPAQDVTGAKADERVAAHAALFG